MYVEKVLMSSACLILNNFDLSVLRYYDFIQRKGTKEEPAVTALCYNLVYRGSFSFFPLNVFDSANY